MQGSLLKSTVTTSLQTENGFLKYLTGSLSLFLLLALLQITSIEPVHFHIQPTRNISQHI